MLGTPPRGTQSSAAAIFASPSSPVPRRPGGTPTPLTSPASLRGVLSPLSHRRPQPRQRASLTPHSSQSSMDRYVSAPSRQHTSMAHFLLTSTEQKTPMLIRAAQQQQQQQLAAMRSPSRESSLPGASLEDAYPSPTRYAVDRSSPTGGAASPRPHGSLPRAGSTRLSSVFAKMHLDPSVRSSRDRSISNASMTGGGGEGTAGAPGGLGGGGDDDASSPPTFSLAASTMEMEPYTTKLARTLFSDMPQTTVLSVNDTSMRPTVTSATAAATAAGATKAAASLRTSATPLSPEVADPSLHGASAFDVDGSSDRAGEVADENYRGDDISGTKGPNDAVSEEECYSDAENDDRRKVVSPAAGGRGESRGGLFSGISRVPLSDSEVNLYGMSEGARYDAALGVVFECNRTRNFTTPSFRVIPHTPERILDAADMEDDFYMNLIDWSVASDVLCVALQSCVYLWDAKTCAITELPRVTSSALGETSRTTNAQLVCGLSWAPDGHHLAVGRNSGLVEVWDVEAQQIVHSYRQHTDRTVSLSWEPQGGSLLASGSRDSTIVLRDVRERDTSVSPFGGSFHTSFSSQASATSVLQGHETEVCGLKWSPNGAMLASGGNDNQLLLWDRRRIATGSGGRADGISSSASTYSSSSAAQPLFYLNKHTAAVKALSWNPAQPALLASGGGSHDKSLRFWNTLTGECIHHINTGSQVCGVVWNRTGTELVTAHGYTDNQLSIWRYPSLRRTANLIGHTSRVLHLALSADGETVVSAAGDETLRFWRCFPANDQRESSPHLYRSFYSPTTPSSLSGSVHGGGGGSPGVSGSATRARAAALAAGRCGSVSQDRERLPFMNEEVELR